MGKIIAAINVTLDGIRDHDAVNPDESIHQHYTDLILASDVILYGRVTYQLMADAWPAMVAHPTGQKALDDFALAIDRIPKIVFSRTLKDVQWKSAMRAKSDLQQEIVDLKQKYQGDILIGSPGLIIQALNQQLVDELQLCIHPVIAGKGKLLFDSIAERIVLNLTHTKTFDCGAVIHYYEPARNSGL